MICFNKKLYNIYNFWYSFVSNLDKINEYNYSIYEKTL